MFGYFNPRNSISNFRNIRKNYRKYYCSTCKALQHNYGFLSKVLLSCDIALLAMFLNLDKRCAKAFKFPCFIYCGSFKNVKNNNVWRTIAAFNVLLFAGKINDDINDDDSLIAKIVSMIYKPTIKRATEDFPTMAKEINDGYLRILKHEEQNTDALTMAQVFSEMMCLAISSHLDISEQQKKFLVAITSWVYIIDALDDYESDLKKKRFNPFVVKGMCFKAYVESNGQNVLDIIDVIFANCLTYDDDSFNYIAAEILINNFIPDVTQKILAGISLKTVQLKATLLDFDRWLPWKEKN
ncbi:MAG: DUF5685 family protein [Oscillospiraceae bacterium]|nr:DUF5685 family protein [Oscillospiraceae bacterium]